MTTQKNGKIIRRRKRPILDLPVHILERLRSEGPLSRVELARRIGIGAATAGSYVEKLVEAGLLFERDDSTEAYGGKGRPPTLVDLNPQGGCIVGVDLEGSLLRAIRFNFRLEPQTERVETVPEDIDGRSLRRTLVRAIQAVRPAEGENWLGIGLAVPNSLLDPDSFDETSSDPGGIPKTRLFSGVELADLVEAVSSRFGVAVEAENDMCCMAYGERLAGRAKRHDYFLCLASRANWSGAAVFANGELTSGPQRGLDIGSWLLSSRLLVSGQGIDLDIPGVSDEEGRKRHMLKHLSSKEGLLAAYDAVRKRKNPRERPTAEDFDSYCERLENGEDDAIEALEPAAGAIGRVIARIDDIMNFDAVVLDGILVDLGPRFLESVTRHFRRFSMRYAEPGEGEKILFSPLEGRSAAIGAAGRVLHHWEPSEKSSSGGRRPAK